jgi:hypothetical protein
MAASGQKILSQILRWGKETGYDYPKCYRSANPIYCVEDGKRG